MRSCDTIIFTFTYCSLVNPSTIIRMKKLYLTLSLILICKALLSQTDTLYIPFIAYWEVGDQYEFETTKIKKQ